jgi:hypothetical protein
MNPRWIKISTKENKKVLTVSVVLTKRDPAPKLNVDTSVVKQWLNDNGHDVVSCLEGDSVSNSGDVLEGQWKFTLVGYEKPSVKPPVKTLRRKTKVDKKVVPVVNSVKTEE